MSWQVEEMTGVYCEVETIESSGLGHKMFVLTVKSLKGSTQSMTRAWHTSSSFKQIS